MSGAGMLPFRRIACPGLWLEAGHGFAFIRFQSSPTPINASDEIWYVVEQLATEFSMHGTTGRIARGGLKRSEGRRANQDGRALPRRVAFAARRLFSRGCSGRGGSWETDHSDRWRRLRRHGLSRPSGGGSRCSLSTLRQSRREVSHDELDADAVLDRWNVCIRVLCESPSLPMVPAI